MAVTEQQFIEQYKGLDSAKQQSMYKAANSTVKGWIDSYNASQNTGNDYAEGGYTPSTQYNQGNNLGNWNYGADTLDRQEEIVANLNEAYTQDPSKFSDWNTFANNFNYNYSGRSDMERNTMKNWYEDKMRQGTGMDYNNVNNADYFLGQLINGQTLGGTGAAATAAQNRYRDYQSLSGMTPEQIASAVSSNSINPVGQSMIDLKNYSPQLYAQVQSILQNQTTVNDINAAGRGIYEGLTKTESNSNYTKYNFTDEYAKNASVIKEYNESLYKKIEGLGGDTAAYVSIVASMLQNPLIQANKDEIENIEGEINKIQENIYTIGDTAREKLGSEAPEDLVSAYISHQTKQLQNQLRTAQNSLLVAQGKLDNQLSEVETMIDAINNGIELQQYSDKMALAGTPTSTTTTTSGSGGGGGGGSYTYTTQPTQDKYNYQDDSEARLKQIASNLENYAKTNPELFKDRNTFNDFFKYNQRSQKQKDILNAAWMKYGKMFGAGSFATGGTGTGSTTSENDLVNAIKKDLIGRTVNFSSSAMKKTYGKYGTQAQSWDEDTTNDYLQEIGKISSVSELKSMLSHLSKDANKKALLASLKTKVVNELKAIEGEGKNATEKAADKKKKQNEKLKSYATKLGIDATTLATRWGLLKK